MNETGPVVFVVDDDPIVCTSMKRLIRTLGLEVQTFNSAQDFLLAKRPDAPGCLVLDVRLPDLSGLDLQQELAKARIDLPIIFVTGHADIPMSVRAMKAGAVEFLTKPFQEPVYSGGNSARHRARSRDARKASRYFAIAATS